MTWSRWQPSSSELASGALTAAPVTRAVYFSISLLFIEMIVFCKENKIIGGG
jgi:hypothetical protein